MLCQSEAYSGIVLSPASHCAEAAFSLFDNAVSIYFPTRNQTWCPISSGAVNMASLFHAFFLILLCAVLLILLDKLFILTDTAKSNYQAMR